MHTTTLHKPLSITSTVLLTGTLTLGIIGHDAAAPAASATFGSVATTAVTPAPTSTTSPETSSAPTPHRISGGVADVLVQISGVGVCSGTPITGTPFVVTAAHCVLDHDGNVVSGTVIRGGVGYHVAAVLVDIRYHETPVAALDAAVLVVDRPIPGPSASLGTALPVTGLVTLAGFQPLDRDGTLLRGTNPHNLPLPTAARGEAGVVRIDAAPAGCEIDIASVDATRAWVNVPCGLIPGASGGGLFATDGDSFELVGILSWVSADIRQNGVVPIDSLLELLEHQADYLHVPTPDTHAASTAHVIHS